VDGLLAGVPARARFAARAAAGGKAALVFLVVGFCEPDAVAPRDVSQTLCHGALEWKAALRP